MQDLTARYKKGKSILRKIADYTVVDIETTGLCPAIDEIIEIGALKVRNGKITEEYSELIKPQFPISEFITQINGISNDMVKDSPSISDIIKDFYDFIGDDIIVGFCPSFDVNFLYDACQIQGIDLTNDYLDVRKIAKTVLPNFKEETHRRYKLKNLVWYFKFGKQEHRALSDCTYTKMLYDKLNELAEEQHIDYTYIPHYESQNAKDIKRQNTDLTLFNGEKFVFTGKLAYMQRKEAMQYVVDYGGTIGDHLTKDTDYLVMGTQDYSRLAGDKSKKQLQAEKFISQGEDINIITEDVFYDMIQFEKPTSGENESAESYWPSFKMTEEEANEWSEMMTKEYIDNLPADKAKYIQKKIDEGTLKIY